MSRRRRPLVPGARDGLDQLKAHVMNQNGFKIDSHHPEQAKVEMANEIGVPLNKGDNGNLTSREAGKVGGPIGGNMVSELIKMAKNQLNRPE
ncbi:alpha/beta-type small acid-soluble spore protein [Bacillus pinisoli]|uniref:alpha/beta-type small acid-soluble spore protein n=1 Tax=Bacillus pinisoli TaxID=2901866 RepID=UPI001FF4058A|nr:alpha/beta-type small acid-soluble spore protein [Bacillus pinisoli]